jgi:hypothetical protein
MGGNAFKDQTQRISLNEIQPTIKWLSDNLGDRQLTVEYLMNSLLGSAGKRDSSGDIDVNLDDGSFDLEMITVHLETLLGDQHVKSRPGNKQIFTSVPIAGRPGDRVQIDFMFGNTAWQRFSFWSSSTSQFKGLYRTELIKALVAYNSDWVLHEDGEMVARVGPTFFHDRGILWRYRHRPLKQNGEGRIQALKELSRDHFMALYPTATQATQDVLIDPVRVMKLILPNSPYSCHDSFETLWAEVTHEYDLADRSKIRDIYLERLNSLKAELPKEIKDALERDCK